MNSITSPPEPEIRHQILSPVSPKPLHFPSPSNIPILGKQMDPNFNDTLSHDLLQTHIQQPSYQGQGPSGVEIHTGVDMNAAAQAAQDYDPQTNFLASLPTPTQLSREWDHGAGHAAPLSTPADTQSFGDKALPSRSHPFQDQPTLAQSSITETVDFDALLANLSEPPTNVFVNQPASHQSHVVPPQPGFNGESAEPGDSNHTLPQRPPTQDTSAIHPSYNPPGSFGAPTLQTVIPGGNGNQQFPQQPGSATFPLHTPETPTFPQQQQANDPRANGGDRWDAETQRKYDEFLAGERMYDQDRGWQKFPDGSRLFVGNLPTELVNKRDLFQRFYRYGTIVQISIKKAFGFVQFFDQEICRRALSGEQGTVIQGRKINLEVSRPQQDRNQQSGGGGGRENRRRSRSPARNRGQQNQNGRDRHRDRAGSPREGDRHYRPGRSPSPRGHRGGRRNRSPARGDRYDGRRRTPSPVGRYAPIQSPRRFEDDDGLPIPRRHPADVPDVQVIVNDNIERNFVVFIESQFTQKGLRTDVLFLAAGIPREAVVKRQAREGVLAVVDLDRNSIASYSISVMLFDRSQGAGNVKFEVYDRLRPEDAPQFVVRQKEKTMARPQSGHAQPQQPWGMPQPYNFQSSPQAQQFNAPMLHQGPPSAGLGSNDLNNLLQTINSNPELQRLVAQAQQQNSHPGMPQQHQPPGVGQADLANLLRNVQQPGQQQQQQMYGQPQHQPPTPTGQQNSLAALTALLGSVGGASMPTSPTAGAMPQQRSAQQAQPDMTELMAQLAQYNGRK